MRVIFNRLAALGQKTGVGHYTDQLARALCHASSDVHVDLFPGHRLWPVANAVSRALPCWRALAGRSRAPARPSRGAVLRAAAQAPFAWLYDFSRAAFHRRFCAAVNEASYDLYHEPNFIPYPSSLRTVVTLHDLSALLYPQWHPPERVARHEAGLPQHLSRCAFVLTDSEFVRTQAIRHLHLPPGRVRCVYPGIKAQFGPLPAGEVAAALRRLRLEPGYLLHLGTIEPRKNLVMLMQAYCALPESLRERCPLLLVGPWGWRTEAIADFYYREGRPKGVRHIGYIDDCFLPALYNGARALVYPSFYEGFGLPPVEMLACGGAVLASTAESLVEILGRHGHLLDPRDVDGWRDAMQRVIADDDWRHELQRGARARAATFSWQRAARETLAVYRQLGTPATRSSAA